MASVVEASMAADTLVEPAPVGLTRSGAARLDTIDMLRGLVIVIMVLDHVRDFFHIDALRFDPTDPLRTNAALFATRWITHLCAATFVFLAGVSILFQKANGKPPAQLSAFLLKRGLWLILLEATVVSFGFNFAEPIVFLQVIWAIGASMVCMSVLARLSPQAVLAVGIGIIALYPLLVPLTASWTGALAILRMLAIAPGVIPGTPVLAFYAFVPWLGVMCIGFGLGPIYRLPAPDRDRRLLPIAIGLLVAFVVLRSIDGYGDPAPWSHLSTHEATALSFLNVSKYPPSPDYVLATLGISILLFLALERLRGPASRVLLTFGRTPLFSYLCHIYLAHGLALAVALMAGYPSSVTTHFVEQETPSPAGWGFSLATVYLAWATVLVLLFPLSRWFERVKQRRRDWWLSYL